MFPSSGYFRAYFCPYFANGLCERPHCHFRHVREDPPTISLPPRASNQPALSGLSGLMGAGDKPDLLMLVREAVLQVQKEVEEDRAKLKGTATKNAQQQQLENNAVAILKNGVKCSSVQADVGPVEYKPTPIAKLKKLQEHNKLVGGSTSSLEYVPESISSNGKIDSPGYKPSLKIPYIPVSKATNKKNVEYIPSPTCNATNAQHSNSDDDDRNDELDANFSGDDEDDLKSDVCDKTTEEKIKAPTTTESEFDVVNQILTKSKLCDSLIKSASQPGTKNAPLTSKKDKLVKSTANAKKSKTKLVSEKKIEKKKSVSFNLLSNKEEGSSAKISERDQTKLISKSKSMEKSKDGKVEMSILKKFDSKSKDGDSEKHSKSKHNNINKKKKTSDKDVSKKKSISSTDKKKHESAKGGGKHSKSESKIKKDSSKSDKNNGKIVHQKTSDSTESTSGAHSVNDDKVNSQQLIEGKRAAHNSIEIPKLNPEDLDFDLDEHDTYEECLQIFNEYTPKLAQSSSEKHEENAADKPVEQIWTGKKRFAHDMGATITKRPKVVPHFQPPPGQVMHTRFIELQKMMREAAQNNVTKASDTDRPLQRTPTQSTSAFLNTVTLASCGKKRIAHVPNVSAMLNPNHHPSNAISRSPYNVETGNSNETATAVVHQITKGTKRIAHMPDLTTLKRPIVPPDYGSRVPNNIRQRYLNLIIDECLKIYDTEQDAFDRGLAEEKNSYDRSSTRTVYINVVVNTIKRLRSEQEGIIPTPIVASQEVKPCTSKPQSVAKPTLVSSKRPSLSHEAILGGKKATNTSYSIQKHKYLEATLTGAAFYKALLPYVLTQQQLEENGFPMQHPTDRNKAIIVKQDTKKKKRPESLEKICCRCGSSFKVTPKGVYLTKDECFYHWGKSYKFRSNGAWETRYSCCQGGHGSEKCSVAKLHVYDEVDYDNLNGFVKLLPKSPPINGDFKAYSLDCEMCYTGFGLELTRVTVIGQDLNVHYETLVKPENPVIDYNTRFSGIKEGDLTYVTTTLRDVQAVLMNLCSDQTVLIGHSLESDFKMLKLIHKTVVDTSVVFPHRLGPPYKKALRTLSAEILQKIIQNSDSSSVDGHDSREDAVVCMELMLMKVKEDIKKLC